MEFSEYNRLTSQEQFAWVNAHFWQVGLLDIVLSEYHHHFYDVITLVLYCQQLYQV